MNKLNKKGFEASDLVKLLLAVLFLVVMVIIFTGDTSESTKVMREVLRSGDFDGDNQNNLFASDISDPCPCGADNQKQLRASNQMEYCVLPANLCESYNNLATQMYKELERKTNPNAQFFFVDGGKCLYTVTGCKYYIAYMTKTD